MASETATRQPDAVLPRPPREPDLDECCGSGCDPCVFDLYEQRLERWRERCRELTATGEEKPERST